MKASMFGVYKVCIRHPDAIHYRVAKEHGLVDPVIKPLVCPLLSKEDVQQKVLVITATAESKSTIKTRLSRVFLSSKFFINEHFQITILSSLVNISNSLR